MKRTMLYAAALLTVLSACDQKDNVTPHTQPSAPGASPQPKPLVGKPQAAPGGGNPVYPGTAPVTPGGAAAQGEGTTPGQAPGAAESAPPK